MVLLCLLAVLSSLTVAVLLIRFQRFHARFTADYDLDGIQKFHAKPVPRIGGVPVICGMLVAAVVMRIWRADPTGLLLLSVSLPAFLAGLTEDVTKRVGVRTRLFATFLSALIGGLVLQATVSRLNVPVVDNLLTQYPLLAMLFTIFAVGGVAHSINIIDGYNGLSGMVTTLIFLGLAYVCFKVGDNSLATAACASAGAVFGFLLVNYPRGLIFAGDGGAYLIGFLIAEISVLLVARHPEVSPWCPLLLVIYPVFETLFSIYRRRFLQARSVGSPDALHLHQIVYKRLVRWMVGSKEAEHLTRRNSLTAPYLWALALFSVAPAMLFWNRTPVLVSCVVVFVVFYVYLYRMIVHFKSPQWLVTRNRVRLRRK